PRPTWGGTPASITAWAMAAGPGRLVARGFTQYTASPRPSASSSRARWVAVGVQIHTASASSMAAPASVVARAPGLARANSWARSPSTSHTATTGASAWPARCRARRAREWAPPMKPHPTMATRSSALVSPSALVPPARTPLRVPAALDVEARAPGQRGGTDSGRAEAVPHVVHGARRRLPSRLRGRPVQAELAGAVLHQVGDAHARQPHPGTHVHLLQQSQGHTGYVGGGVDGCGNAVGPGDGGEVVEAHLQGDGAPGQAGGPQTAGDG